MNDLNVNLRHVMEKRLERVEKNLVRNRMEVFRAANLAQVANIVEELLKDGDTIVSGGSMSIEDCGLLELLRLNCYKFLDKTGKTPEEQEAVARSAFTSDVFITGTNAVTENGELYNVDGRGNRVAAIAYGPKTVIVLAGYNKIVKDLDEAVSRVKRISAPANTRRLDRDTFCRENGVCMAQDGDMGAGCHCDERICSSGLITAHQIVANRIKVILISEATGF